MYRTAYNPTASPVVVDDEGRIIGGRDWGTYDTTEDVAGRAIQAGDLLPVDLPEDTSSVDPRALAAFERTAAIQARLDDARGIDKDVLREAAVDAGLITPSDDPGVRDLREVVAEHPEVTLPTPAKSTTRKRTSQEA